MMIAGILIKGLLTPSLRRIEVMDYITWMKTKPLLVVGQIHTHPNTGEGFDKKPDDSEYGAEYGDFGFSIRYDLPVYTIEPGGDIDKLTPSGVTDDYSNVQGTQIEWDALKEKIKLENQ